MEPVERIDHTQVYIKSFRSTEYGDGAFVSHIEGKNEALRLSQRIARISKVELDLTGIVYSLRALLPDEQFTLWTRNKLIVDTVEQGHLLNWEELNWQRPGGKELRAEPLWKQLYKILYGHRAVDREFTFRTIRGPEMDEAMSLARQAYIGEFSHRQVDEGLKNWR